MIFRLLFHEATCNLLDHVLYISYNFTIFISVTLCRQTHIPRQLRQLDSLLCSALEVETKPITKGEKYSYFIAVA